MHQPMSLPHVQTISFTPCIKQCIYPMHHPMPLNHAQTMYFTPCTNLWHYPLHQPMPLPHEPTYAVTSSINFETVDGNNCLPCYTNLCLYAIAVLIARQLRTKLFWKPIGAGAWVHIAAQAYLFAICSLLFFMCIFCVFHASRSAFQVYRPFNGR